MASDPVSGVLSTSQPLRILRVISSVDLRGGGPIEGLIRSTAVMTSLGHHTEIVCLDAPGADYIKDVPVPVHPQGRMIKKYGFTPKLPRWIRANANRFDVALVHGVWNHASVGGWQGLTSAGLPYFMFTHGMLDPWFRGAYPLKHAAKQAFWLLAQGRVLRDAESVLFTSEEERARADGVFWGFDYKSRVVPYGSSQPPASIARDGGRLRAALPGLAGRRYILFLGRIHPKKGCDLLVRAFARVAQAYPDVDLVVAGPDQVGQRAELEAIARAAGVGDRIHWPGMLRGDVKWEALAGADAFILPSHQENFGIAVAEALSCGIPVLISDKVNIWREIVASDAGMVEPDTEEGTFNLLNRFLALAPDRRAALGQAARAAYERHFDIDVSARALEALLLSAVHHDKKSSAGAPGKVDHT